MQREPGTALLHEDRNQPGVDRTRSEESVQHAGPQPGVEVVHVGPEFAQRARWPVREAP
jgi:hypothetical protein